jgi:hypothetical protein
MDQAGRYGVDCDPLPSHRFAQGQAQIIKRRLAGGVIRAARLRHHAGDTRNIYDPTPARLTHSWKKTIDQLNSYENVAIERFGP